MSFTPLVASSCPKVSNKEASGYPGQRLLWSTLLWLTKTAKQYGTAHTHQRPALFLDHWEEIARVAVLSPTVP